MPVVECGITEAEKPTMGQEQPPAPPPRPAQPLATTDDDARPVQWSEAQQRFYDMLDARLILKYPNATRELLLPWHYPEKWKRPRLEDSVPRYSLDGGKVVLQEMATQPSSSSSAPAAAAANNAQPPKKAARVSSPSSSSSSSTTAHGTAASSSSSRSTAAPSSSSSSSTTAIVPLPDLSRNGWVERGKSKWECAKQEVRQAPATNLFLAAELEKLADIYEANGSKEKEWSAYAAKKQAKILRGLEWEVRLCLVGVEPAACLHRAAPHALILPRGQPFLLRYSEELLARLIRCHTG